MSKRKIGEWIYRIFCFTIIDNLIAVIGFVGIHYSLVTLIELEKMSTGVSIGLLQVGLGICYLRVVNLFYWIGDINLLDFKQLWRKEK